MVMEWDQIVKCISVSSSEDLAYRLMDGNQTTCWQSSGNQGKVLAGVDHMRVGGMLSVVVQG